ncbi:MAG: DNA/RNA nuclease SfsA [Chloroflexi bacterium]|nr:DNA/RNA nuclease SfsA [Chloroflexota bacterium]
MKLHPALVKATFLRRLNRFAAEVVLDGQAVPVHVANSGRMHELLQAGHRCYLAPAPAATGREKPGDAQRRKTAYDLALVEVPSHPERPGGLCEPPGQLRSSSGVPEDAGPGRTLVSADARLPPRLVEEALRRRILLPFAAYADVRREVAWGGSRLDLLLSGAQGHCLLEVKSVTLVVDGVGLFPDAPTARGRRHLLALARGVEQGYRAAVLFVIQRADASAFAPNDTADPAFGEALREAHRHGVEVYAHRCKVSKAELHLSDPVSVRLHRRAGEDG